MTKWICALFTFAFVAALAPFDAEARRLAWADEDGQAGVVSL